MNLSPKFDQALQYAVLIHAFQKRKDTEIPYVAHLLGVASIALEHGASEDEAIGALLHDAGEDAGGEGRLARMHHKFSSRAHPLFALLEGEKATLSRSAPTKSARRVQASHLWGVMLAG